MEEISKGMVTPLPVQYSKFLKDAMEGPGTTEAELTEILCGNDNAMIRDIVQSYTESTFYHFFVKFLAIVSKSPKMDFLI